MLARIRRRQEDDNPALVHTRPDRNSRCQDFIKSVLIRAGRAKIEYVSTAQKCICILIDLKQ
jgi:hypothetical protein